MKKTGTIFDLIDETPQEGIEGYAELAKQAPSPKDNSFFNTIKEYGKTALKGGIEGVSRLGLVMGPLQTGKSSQRQLDEQSEILDQFLPTQDTFGQRTVREGLKEIPSSVAQPFGGPIQSAIRGGLSGAAGETVKEYGGPEWAQTIAKIAPFLGPDITKKLIEKGNYKKIIQEARKLGLSDKEITPLIQSELKQKWLSKIAPKKGTVKESISSTKRALDQAYEKMNVSEKATEILPAKSANELLEGLIDASGKLPSEARNRVMKDVEELFTNPITGQSMFNLWKDINYYLSKGEKQLGILKEPLRKAISTLSPELGKDFETINLMYTKYYPIAQKLKPTKSDDFISAIEKLGLLGGVMTWNFPLIKTLAGEQAAKQIAKHMLVNPKFQQIGNKMVVAVNENKYNLAVKAIDELKKEMKKIDPNYSTAFPILTEEEMKELLNPEKS